MNRDTLTNFLQHLHTEDCYPNTSWTCFWLAWIQPNVSCWDVHGANHYQLATQFPADKDWIDITWQL